MDTPGIDAIGGSGEPMFGCLSGAERLVLCRAYAPRYPSFSKAEVNCFLHPLLLPFEVPSQARLHERKQQKKGDDTIAANPDNADPMSASNADEMDGEMDEEMRENWKKCAMRR